MGQVDERTARVTLKVGDEVLQPALTLGEDGSLRHVEMPRWDVAVGEGIPGSILWKADRRPPDI